MPGFEHFGDEERKEVNDVLESGVLMRYGFDPMRNGHWKADEFEAALAKRMGTKHAHVCSSGTAAVATAMAACGIGAGDEVIVPPFTFVADIEMALLAGARPVFAEIDETLCLDPKSVDERITPNTKAVLLVHMCGSMAKLDELVEVCERRGVTLIEDAAQAIGGSYKGRPLGTYGRCGCFSFDFVKIVTAGEGGGIITDDDDVARIASQYTDHGHDHLGSDRGADEHPYLGQNFRISELHAAVGLAQLRKLDGFLEIQRRHKTTLKQGLADLDHLEMRHVPDASGDTGAFLSFMLPTADDARRTVKDLGEAGVDGCFHWFDNNWHYHRRWDHLKQGLGPAPLSPASRGWADGVELPQSDAIMGRTVSMLIKLGWTDEQVRERLERMKSVMAALPAG